MTTGVFIQTNVSNILKEFTSIFHQRNPVNRIAYLVFTLSRMSADMISFRTNALQYNENNVRLCSV